MADYGRPENEPTNHEPLPSRPNLDWKSGSWEAQDVGLPMFPLDELEIGTGHDWLETTGHAAVVANDTRNGEEKPPGQAAQQPWRMCIGAFHSLFDQVEKLVEENTRLKQQHEKLEADLKDTKW
jgi:hypothetical protein